LIRRYCLKQFVFAAKILTASQDHHAMPPQSQLSPSLVRDVSGISCAPRLDWKYTISLLGAKDGYRRRLRAASNACAAIGSQRSAIPCTSREATTVRQHGTCAIQRSDCMTP
jgi:hypothetical protein